MNKDALLATIIGFGIGLVIAAGVFLGPSLFKNMPQLRLPDLSSLLNTFKTSENREPTPTPKPNETLTIQSPLADSIEPKNETLISGMTAPEAIVVIEGESTETVVLENSGGVDSCAS